MANSILRPFRENISYLLRNKAHNVEKPSLVRHASETQLDCSGAALGVVFPLCFEAFEAIEHSCQSSKK